MRSVAAPLAAALLASRSAGCGGDGAEPGAPEGATLVLDFQPNAVHAGIYAAQASGDFEDEGVDLRSASPPRTSDGAKLLEAGRADFAVMDINDFGIARERGADLVAIAAIVQRPLASVIARDRNEVRTLPTSPGRGSASPASPPTTRSSTRCSAPAAVDPASRADHDRLQRRPASPPGGSTPPPPSGTRRASSSAGSASPPASSGRRVRRPRYPELVAGQPSG